MTGAAFSANLNFEKSYSVKLDSALRHFSEGGDSLHIVLQLYYTVSAEKPGRDRRSGLSHYVKDKLEEFPVVRFYSSVSILAINDNCLREV